MTQDDRIVRPQASALPDDAGANDLGVLADERFEISTCEGVDRDDDPAGSSPGLLEVIDGAKGPGRH